MPLMEYLICVKYFEGNLRADKNFELRRNDTIIIISALYRVFTRLGDIAFYGVREDERQRTII